MPIATDNSHTGHSVQVNQLPKRVSNIPRPTKQLLEQQQLNHASKPLTDILPRTPAAKIINNQNLNKPERRALAPKMTQQQDVDPEVAVLELTPFCRQPIVNFGQVEVGTSQCKTVVLRNSQQTQQQLFVITFPKPVKGLYIDATEFLIAGRTETSVSIAWTPKSIGSIRETITLQDINRMPRRIVVLGTAFKPLPDAPRSVRSTHRSMYRFNRMPTKLSPTKTHRKLTQERTQLVFSPASKRAIPKLHDKGENKPLTKLVHDSRRRHSALMVRKILSQYDTTMATRIQSYCRMVLAKRQLSQLHQRKDAIIKIQSFVRMFLVRNKLFNEHKAATTIKAYWKMYLARKKYLDTRKSLICVQSHCRVVLARRELARLKSLHVMIVRMQARARGVICRRGLLRELRERRDALTKIQSYVRMILARREYNQLQTKHNAVTAAINIQSFFRMILAQREVAALRRSHRAATVIATYWKRHVARERYLKARESLICVQAHWRGVLARRELTRLKLLVKLIVRIQSYGRGVILRRGQLRQLRERRDTVIKIQSYARMIKVQRDFAELKARHKAATAIKAYWKGYVVRRRYMGARGSVIRLQSHWRGILARQEFVRLKSLVAIIVRLQSYGRGMIFRRELDHSIRALHNCQSRAIAERIGASYQRLCAID